MRKQALATLVFLVGVVVAHNAHAATQQEALNALYAGDYEQALQHFQALQLESPDNPEVLYGLGCVQYQRGLGRLEVRAGEEAEAAFKEARAAFGGVLAGSETRLHADAAFNLANVLSQEAELVPPDQFQPKVAKYREAIAAYERVLEAHPTQEGARHNLDYVRYRLKLLLQEAQQEEEQEQEQEQDQQQPPPQVMVIFESAYTDIPGADAVPQGNVVELVRPGVGGGTAGGGGQ